MTAADPWQLQQHSTSVVIHLLKVQSSLRLCSTSRYQGALAFSAAAAVAAVAAALLRLRALLLALLLLLLLRISCREFSQGAAATRPARLSCHHLRPRIVLLS